MEKTVGSITSLANMVYIIANNILSPLGETTRENYDAVKEGRSALSLYTHRWNIPEPFTASLFNDEENRHLSIPGLSHFESMAVSSIRRALADISTDITQANTVLILSTTKGNIESLEHAGDATSGILPGDSAKRIAETLNIRQLPIVVCNACISGLSAIILASRLLEAHEYDYAIVCGADSQSRFIVSGFQSFKALSPEPCRPFDMERLGLNLGEAAATLVLSTKPQEGKPWRITSGAVRNDAYHISAPAKNGEGARLALCAAISGHEQENFAFINAHGTATMFNDQMESVAIERAGLTAIPVNSLKGYYGHTMGAAGVLETILSMEAVDDHTIVGTKGFEELGVSGRLLVSPTHQSTSEQGFIKMLSGFGGCNAVICATKSSLETEQRKDTMSYRQTHHIQITPDRVCVDDKVLDVETERGDLITGIYKRHIADYPKFYKMDGLSRLGFVASELLLQAEGVADEPAEDVSRAVILFNHSSSIAADRKYVESIENADEYFPSPSLFVYTLPNIVTGEIAIRHHYHGETSFYILPQRDNRIMTQILRCSFLDPSTRSAICGWLDFEDDRHYMADLSIIEHIN